MSQLRKDVYYNNYGTADLEAFVQQQKNADYLHAKPAVEMIISAESPTLIKICLALLAQSEESTWVV